MTNIPNRGSRVNSRFQRSSNHHVNVTLLALVQADVALTLRHGEWWGKCPFHADKTPSFSVHPEKEVYYCFGCGAKGDAIEYLRRSRGYSFAQAAEMVGKEGPPRERTVRARPTDVQAEQARYWAWWREKLAAWNELLDDIRCTEIAYRDQCAKLGETMSDASYSFWSQRLGALYARQSYEQQLLNATDAERFAAWREDAGKS
jgi:hypothetical protein